MSLRKRKHLLIRLVTILLVGTVFVLASCTTAQSGLKRSRLALPYDGARYTKASSADFACPGAPAEAPTDLIFQSVYSRSDPHRATVDPRAEKNYARETAASRRFENQLLRMSNDYLRTGAPQKAQCVLDWLYGWARRGALLGKTNDMGIAVRQWILASVGSAYAQIRDEKDLDKRKRKIVEHWLRETAEAVMQDYPEDAVQGRKINNHLYWAAWAVTITGVSLDDRDLYEWGINRAKSALTEQFQDDGTLPLEMARGKKALHYHIFSALPLIMLAETGERNGDRLYEMRDGILHRFVQKILEGAKDPSYFEVKAESEQTPFSELHPGHLAWMEVYHHRFPSPDIAARLKDLRPLFLRRIGGDMTFLYRRD